jgi:hypothetical protein
MICPFYLPVGLLALLATPTFADFPYNPTRIFVTNNGSSAYIFSSQSSTSQSSLQLLNTSGTIDISNASLSTSTTNLPFLTSSSTRAFTPILTGDDLNVLAGDCSDRPKDTELWHFAPGKDQGAGTWEKLSLSSIDSAASSNFLSAGFTFWRNVPQWRLCSRRLDLERRILQ